MPDYKKKRVNRLFSAPKKVKKSRLHSEPDNNIEMTEMTREKPVKKEKQPKSSMRVVKGKKLEQKRRLKFFASFAAGIVLICFILQLVLPGGIIENIENITALIGSGSYPIDLESTETLNAVSKGSYYYVLTDTRLNAFTNAGKLVYSNPHGYEHPVLKTSKTRALVFDQSGTDFMIYNLREKKTGSSLKTDIITAAISDSGTYAIVARSDTYASAVSVYDKNDNLIYEWFSSEDTVNNIIISPNGKRIAVSTLNSVSGQYNSKISVFNYSSATPEFTASYEGTVVYALDSTHNRGFIAVTANNCDFYSWSEYKKSEYKNIYNTAMLRTGSGGSVAVFNRESDKTDNRVAVFSATGQLKTEFEFKGIISDIQISKGHIYCISDTEVYLLGDDGAVLRKAECGFGAVRLAVTGTNLTAVITDNKIEEIKFEQE